jgi:hypothetical protein
MARASKYSKEPEIRKAFDDIDVNGFGTLTFSDVLIYLCDHLGFGQSEALKMFHGKECPGIDFEHFRQFYVALNPYMICHRSQEFIVRKPGCIRGEGVTLERVEDCEVYICDRSAQVFLDFCKRSLILVGPCESSVFVRDCEDCVFWVAAQQLRTNNCYRCTFFMYSRTEPIIETSDNLFFAPWTAKYPQCKAQFEQAGFDLQQNLWNAIFDFSGKADRSHWQIVPLGEICELTVELDEPPDEVTLADAPGLAVTHDMLCAAPCTSGQSCGQSLANIPQTRPPLPEQPAPLTTVAKFVFSDSTEYLQCGISRLNHATSQAGA